MKKKPLLATACAGFALLVSCGESEEAFIDKKGEAPKTLAVAAEVEEAPKDQKISKGLAEQKIGKGLAKEGVLSKLAGKTFADYQLEKAPEYYIVYFSASW